MQQGFKTYKKINTMGMSQLDLILTVYRGTIAYLDQAKTDFTENRLTDGRTACEKARKCIVHLYTTLDMKKGEAIADRLGQLYAFMIQQIDLAIASKSCRLIDEVTGLLKTLKEAWEGLKEQEAERASNESAEIKTNQENGTAGTETPIPPAKSMGKRLTFSA
jgi:flagellar protein FliS